jgi:Na+-transporting methylmalonyl-CoA/oxaloacetate decarboxylase gamma subunit
MWQGVQLMVVGMTTVIAFLTLMVGLMQLSAKVFAGYADLPDTNDQDAGPTDDLTEIAVVIAAIEAWRQQEGA